MGLDDYDDDVGLDDNDGDHDDVGLNVLKRQPG